MMERLKHAKLSTEGLRSRGRVKTNRNYPFLSVLI